MIQPISVLLLFLFSGVRLRIIITLPMLSTSQKATVGMAMRSRQQYHSVDDGAVAVAILDRASVRKCRHVKMDGDRVRETDCGGWK